MGIRKIPMRYTQPVVGWVDSSFGDTLSKVKRKLIDVGVPHPSDRQASSVIAKVFSEIDFDIRRKNKKRIDKLEIHFK
jgi:hypothetical protein